MERLLAKWRELLKVDPSWDISIQREYLGDEWGPPDATIRVDPVHKTADIVLESNLSPQEDEAAIVHELLELISYDQVEIWRAVPDWDQGLDKLFRQARDKFLVRITPLVMKALDAEV